MKNKNLEITKGTCILTEKPFVYVLKSKYRTERCDFCLTANKVLKCSNCNYVYYCNRTCQKEAWPSHKNECAFLKKTLPRIVPDAARILAKIIIKLKNGGDLEKSFYTETCFRKFKDLMSHYPDIKADEKRMEHLECLTSVLKELLGEQMVPNQSELMGIYGRLVVNGFNILDPEMNSVATGLYLGVSVTDHSCTPNAIAIFEGTTLFIRTLKDLPCLDWSKIFISYVDLMSTADDRRSELKSNYYFWCSCSKCIDEKESIDMLAAACPNRNCPELLDLSNEECSQCGEPIKMERKNEFKEVVEFSKMHLLNMKEIAYLDICQILLKRQESMLHPLNILHVKTLDAAFESAIDMGKFDEALSFGIKLLPGFHKYYGELNPLLGLLYMKLGKIFLYQNRIKESSTNLKEAAKILKITHGENHSLYKTQLIPLLMQL